MAKHFNQENEEINIEIDKHFPYQVQTKGAQL